MSLPVSAGFRLRLAVVRACLRFARWWSGRFLFRDKSPGPGPEATDERPAAERYPLVPLGEKLGLERCFEHLTVAATPPEERYPPLVLVAKLAVIAGLSVPLRSEARFGALDQTRALPGSLGPPRALAERWDSDEAFAAMRLQGPNPAWIRRLEAPDPALAALAEGAAGPLFVVDYRALLAGLPLASGRHMAPCAVLFEVRDQQLRTLGVALDRPGRPPLLARPDGSPGWRLARMFFGCADLLVHEALSHFLWTHMVGETLLLATRHHLGEAHPVARVLAPHTLYTLQANENSGSRLLGPEGFFERCFSAGWAGTVALLERGQAAFTFDQLVLPRQLAERGVEGLPGYPYRDDGLLVWGAVARYTRGAVGLLYADDAAVRADAQLRSWGAALTERLGAPALEDREALATVMAAAIFTTVQHTLVNAMQYDAYGWPLAFPSCLHTPLPDDLARVDERDLVEALPSVQEAADALRATFCFSLQFNVFGAGLERYVGPALAPLARQLRAELEGAALEVARRNTRRGYRYEVAALPMLSNSINA